MASYHFHVTSPILHPVAARAGDWLVVQPGHPEAPIAVTRKVGARWRCVRIGPPNYGPLAGYLADGIIQPQCDASRVWLSRVA